MNQKRAVEVDSQLSDFYFEEQVNRKRAENLASMAINYPHYPQYPEQAKEYFAKAAEFRAKAEPLEREYFEAGGWNRFWLVVSSANGHVHNSRNCSSCYSKSVYSWLVEYSGMDEAEFVELAGEDACSVCFPNAPVSALARPSRLSIPEREEKEARRVEREAKAEAKRVKDEANAICNPDGSLIVLGANKKYPNYVRSFFVAKQEYKSARGWVASVSVSNPANPHLPEYQEKVDVLGPALLFKMGEEAFAVFEKKVEKYVAECLSY